MGDAASAVVLSAGPALTGPRIVVRAVTTTTLGTHHALVRAAGCPPRIEVDAAAFERNILPVHFVMCERVLSRALDQAGIRREAISHLVYPNTSALDRSSVARALGFPPEALTGPGPRHLGHAFASDLLLNLPERTTLEPGTTVALLGVGSGFTWGAAILDVEPAP
jgi:3-oxoacyl-[acyl-carrier-protein] synthase III